MNFASKILQPDNKSDENDVKNEGFIGYVRYTLKKSSLLLIPVPIMFKFEEPYFNKN
ncbi:hypothetical protein FEDK69T_22080 [Flavobacterium enshiense DK69]|nr:hypothetical protein FEDK69T_22080 [Flavobacterium enshiense DK69]